MKFLSSLLVVLALTFIAWFGVGVLRLYEIFGIAIPYLALIIFAIGFINRLLKFEQNDSVNSPGTKKLMARRLLELLFFRSFFGNIKMKKQGSKEESGPSNWFWAGVYIFFGAFLIILLRHLRLFLNPVPLFIQGLENIDSFLTIGFPHNAIYITDIVFMVALTVIILRSIYTSFAKNTSLPFSYVPLFLLLGSVLSGIIMAYYWRVNIVSVKELGMGLVTFRPFIPTNLGNILFIHIFLVSSLLVYLAMSSVKPIYQWSASENEANIG
ncbi:menaquinol oxidoreductase [Desulfosporosinus sp. FKA]|uniref:menaquinol oxidoreductase n=1 Tax=Desulfosporosinus sp. FKA TaxID=1969834 RepID=UPI000B49A102|nr:menaquinol oxidoreductase [Desulfosporosinus sp. FKA]